MQTLEFKAALSVSDAGEITGIVWPFGTPDRVGDMIEKGAFNMPARVTMLFAHDQAEPIGIWDTLTEIANGLEVKGRLLVDNVARAKEVRALVREGALTGLSIGFVTKAATNRRGGGRTITALDLHEISVVAIPAHPDAKITSLKSINKGTPMDPETIDAPELETRVAALETDVAAIKDSLGNVEKAATRIETKMARPGPANDNRFAANDNANIEKKAFVNWLRTGRDETKALTTTTGTAIVAPAEVQKSILEKIAGSRQSACLQLPCG